MQIEVGKTEERKKDAAEFEFRWLDNISIYLIVVFSFILFQKSDNNFVVNL